MQERLSCPSSRLKGMTTVFRNRVLLKIFSLGRRVQYSCIVVEKYSQVHIYLSSSATIKDSILSVQTYCCQLSLAHLLDSTDQIHIWVPCQPFCQIWFLGQIWAILIFCKCWFSQYFNSTKSSQWKGVWSTVSPGGYDNIHSACLTLLNLLLGWC